MVGSNYSQDIAGQKFNRWTVIKFSFRKVFSTTSIPYWECICECGIVKDVSEQSLKKGTSQSCGCIKHRRSHRFKDRTGQVFGRLTVIKFDRIEKEHTYWICRCECGNTVSILGNNLVRGKSKSCGCLNKELTIIRNKQYITHGMTNTRFYGVWDGLKYRCLNIKGSGYKNYGGRGITVCDRWLGNNGFENFRDDMYESYLKHIEDFGQDNTSLDRKDNDGNYEPSNCQWATKHEQNMNTRMVAKVDNYDDHLYWRKKLSGRLNKAVSNQISNKLCILTFGIDRDGLRAHLESNFQEDMNWHNRGINRTEKRCWQIDHKLGCNQFDLSKEEDRKICFNYKNFQPLWWEDNIRKRQFAVR
jgi:hypothetical protein